MRRTDTKVRYFLFNLRLLSGEKKIRFVSDPLRLLSNKNFAPAPNFPFYVFLGTKHRFQLLLLQALLAHGQSPDVGSVVLLHGHSALAPGVALEIKKRWVMISSFRSLQWTRTTGLMDFFPFYLVTIESIATNSP